MQSRPFSYLFSISYFGARYKGWAPQPNQPTIQRKLERVLRHVLGHEDFSLIGASRTDSGVSCRGGFVQFFFKEPITLDVFLHEMNLNLPSDIKIKEGKEVRTDFNLIQSVKQKTYRYYFCTSDNFNPLASAFVEHLNYSLDLGLMKSAATLFEGTHDFQAFCKVSPNKSNFTRTVISSKIELGDEFYGNFFPEEIFYFEVTGSGFLHHQVRKMMTAIWNVGIKEWSMEELISRLKDPTKEWPNLPPAPANGLILWETVLENL